MKKIEISGNFTENGIRGFPVNYLKNPISELLSTTAENNASFGTFPSPIGLKLTEYIRVQTDGRTFGKFLFLIQFTSIYKPIFNILILFYFNKMDYEILL